MKKILSAALTLAMCLSLLPAAFAAGGTACVSTQAVEVDGKKVEFQMYALKDASGNPTNYVKLRDVAHVLNGTKAQFSVGYDGSISITTGQPYADTGAEMKTPYSGDRAYREGSGAVKVNGKATDLQSIILTDDAGGDYTYFKLRDLGAALGFKVDWSAQRGVFLETGGAGQEKPKSLLDQLQGVWHGERRVGSNYMDCDVVISGDQISISEHYLSQDWYVLQTGTITEVKTDVAKTHSSGSTSRYPCVIFWTGTESSARKGSIENDSKGVLATENGSFYDALLIRELNLAENYFIEDNNRFEKVAASPVYDKVQVQINAALEAKKKEESTLAKYPTYVKFPKVPDFGGIFKLTDHSNHGKVEYGPWVDPAWVDMMNELNDQLASISDITIYTYESADAGGYDKLLEMETQYIEILKECGFKTEMGETALGGSSLYYTNKEGTSVGFDWQKPSRYQIFPSTLYISVQSKR